MDSGYNLITILGPTASGKTPVAAHLAYKIGGEIISADSRQVYRNMDIGTGKDYKDYVVNNYSVPYHLVDIVNPGYKYNIYEYQRDFYRVFADITARDTFPVLCGGSGLYIEAVLKQYRLLNVPPDQELRKGLFGKSLDELAQILASYKTLHNTTDIDTKKRAIRAIEIAVYQHKYRHKQSSHLRIKPLIIGIHFERATLRKRITDRLHNRLAQGMVGEVESLLQSGLSPNTLKYYGLEYKYITSYLLGEITYDEMVWQLNIAIHQFAKRQMTFFRKMERQGLNIRWISGSLPIEDKLALIMSFQGNA